MCQQQSLYRVSIAISVSCIIPISSSCVNNNLFIMCQQQSLYNVSIAISLSCVNSNLFIMCQQQSIYHVSIAISLSSQYKSLDHVSIAISLSCVNNNLFIMCQQQSLDHVSIAITLSCVKYLKLEDTSLLTQKESHCQLSKTISYLHQPSISAASSLQVPSPNTFLEKIISFICFSQRICKKHMFYNYS